MIFILKYGYIDIYVAEEVDMIEVKTKYNLEIHKEFLRFLYFRGKYYRYKQLTFTITGILLIALWIVFYCLMPGGFLVILLLLFGIMVLLWAHMVPFILSKQNIREVSAISQSELDIVFDENRISIFSAGESPDIANTLRYEAIYRAYEAKNDFYIFITRKHAFIVPKKDVVAGSPDELRTLLQTKMRKRFVICK